MHSPSSPAACAARRVCARAGLLFVLLLTASLLPASPATAQWEDESSISLNAMMKLQAGMFVPLFSDKFQPNQNIAVVRRNSTDMSMDPCDPIVSPRTKCFPINHGQKPGSASIARATLQLEAHWDFTSKLALHTIVRAVKSAKLEADYYGRPPTMLNPELTPEGSGGLDPSVRALRGEYAQEYVQKNYYNEVDLREFYMDYFASDWLSFRVGRQQVAWGETGSFRLLDVVNPSNNLWHFGPLESFEDQRIPLWMLMTNIEIPAMRSSLELLYIPGLDRAHETVNAPLTFSGAWGIPYPNQPPTFQVAYRDFRYPGGELRGANMRGGARLKGVLGDNGGYSLVYMTTHMMNPVLTRVDQALTPAGNFSDVTMDRAILEYPRTHIVGGSFEVTIPSPVASTIRFEGAVDLRRQFSADVQKASIGSPDGIVTFPTLEKQVYSYAVVFQRPTMIRWLNPTQNFLLNAQFRHTYIPTDEQADENFVHVITFNDWRIQKHSYTAILHARTSYAHGKFEPRITGAYVRNPYVESRKGKNSGFVTLDLGFRIGPHYRINVMVTDFFGGDPYRDIGMWRDRDELHASFTLLF